MLCVFYSAGKHAPEAQAIFCRAKIIAVKAGSAGDGHGVPAGTYVDLHLADVPQEAAEKVLQRVEAAKKVR
jgi:hypothetical protein